MTLIVIGGGEHLVGRRGEQEHPGFGLIEQQPGEGSLRPDAVDEVGEALELVKDDEVGSELMDAHFGEQPAQLADELVALSSVEGAPAVRERVQLVPELVAAQALGKGFDHSDGWFELVEPLEVPARSGPRTPTLERS